jgi:hypothetical protein
LARLKRIRDQDYNILKSFDYQYQIAAGCGSGCYVLGMQTLGGSGTLSYPVGVFDINGKLIGNAAGPSDFVTKWNSDTADNRVGTLAIGGDSMHFNIAMNSGQTPPASVTGCRYYQWDLPWTQIDGIFEGGGAYVDFGDGTGMPIPQTSADTNHMAPNTQLLYGIVVHNYPDSSMKTISIYHNDGNEAIGLDNANAPATSLTKVQHLRGNFPQHTTWAKFSSMQQPSALTFDSIYNWNSITSLTTLQVTTGDGGVNPCEHVSYAQDFAKNLKGLSVWSSSGGGYRLAGIRDTTFKLSRLKSDWNTYFTNLQVLKISDDHWNREDLSALTQLQTFVLVATTNDHENDYSNYPISIPTSVLDSVLNQIAAGSGQNVSNGIIVLITGGTRRTSASDAAVALLQSKGWIIDIYF